MTKHDLTGKRFAHYQLVRLLGRGGMADVYLADDTRLNRQVALKVLPPEFARDEERAKRFDKEIRATAGLDHPHITTVYEVGEVNGLHYYTMSLLAGGELKQRIAVGMSEQDAIRVLKEMATALGYAHSKGFVHRDIKPENILFHEDGRSCLTDLGIALAAGSGTRMTATGMSIGTPHYMSPEQCQGEHDLDGRSDLYSLGIVFYEMLTGKVPFDAANTVGIVMKHVQEPVPKLPLNLSKYQPILEGLLAKDRKSRFATAEEVIRVLNLVLLADQQHRSAIAPVSPATTQLMPTTPKADLSQHRSMPKDVPKSSRQSVHGVLWALGGALLAVVVSAGVWYALQNKPAVPGESATMPVANTQVPARSQTESLPPGNLKNQLANVKSGLDISATPINARIYVDNEFSGNAPLELTDLPAGRTVTIRAETGGYEPQEQSVWVSSSRMQQINLELRKIVSRYALTVLPKPPDANVRILNIDPAYRPGMMLEPGNYQVEVSKPGYKTETRWVEVNDQPLNPQITLPRASFALTIQTNPRGATTKLLEPDREYRPGMTLSPGRYRYQVSKAGYESAQGAIVLSDQDVSEYVELRKGWTPGDSLSDCPDCPVMVVIPAGSFMMGSPASESGRNESEGPRHKVTLDKPFAVSKYEVTVAQFKSFATATGYRTDAERNVQIKNGGLENGCYTQKGGWGWHGTADWRNPDFTQSASHPVVCVSWNDAKAYIEWLSDYSGETYRLLTEAEWEYTARANNTKAYPWGDGANSGCRHANGGDRSLRNYWKRMRAETGLIDCDDGHVFTAPVSSFLGNHFGLHEMIGNVWEWLEDCGHSNYTKAPTTGESWLGGRQCSRVLRGGSWNNGPRHLRSANRNWDTPQGRFNDVGFRLARDL